MKIKLHPNGWTIIAEDINLAEITQQEVNLFARYLMTNTVIVIKNQKLTLDDEVRIGKMFGDIESYADTPLRKNFVLDGSQDHIIRVTGELDEHGQPGMFGHVSELEWHCNRVTYPKRKPIIWLYGDRGTVGSRTSWLNNILVYNDLTEEQKQEYADLHLDVGAQAFQGYYSDEMVDYGTHYPKFVHTNQLGVTGLFFPFNQIHFIKEWDHERGRALIEGLRDKIQDDPKYLYHHDWEDGDVVISEQWLSIHKRWEFEGMPKRVLHRIATDFANVDFNDIPPNNEISN